MNPWGDLMMEEEPDMKTFNLAQFNGEAFSQFLMGTLTTYLDEDEVEYCT
jgi:hypothetical protein